MNMIHLLPHIFAATSCNLDGGGFLGLPKWYKYLTGIESIASGPAGDVKICNPQIVGINDFWLIGAAIIEIMIRIGALVAIGFIIWGGIQYITSQGEAESVSKAKKTIIDGIIGLVIAVSATAVITFVAGKF